MIRLMVRCMTAWCLIAALFSSSCVFDNEKKNPDHVSFRLDPVLVGLTRVEIFRLDAQGNPVAPALFNDSLRSLADVENLDARGYGGGTAVFSVKGYKAAQMVYEIKVTFTGATASVQEIKLIPLYSVTLKITDAADLDKDGYKTGYNLVSDVNTNLAEDFILLKYFWKKEGAATWESRGEYSRFRISGSSVDDAVSESMVGGGEQANGTVKVEAYNQDNLLVAEKNLNVREETLDEDDPGFHLRFINHTGAYLDADLTISGQVETVSLAPQETVLVERAFRPASFSYFAYADGDAVIWEDTMAMMDHATYKVILILSSNTEEFFVLNVTNNSTTVADRIVANLGLATETSSKGPIPVDGEPYNAGVFDYSPTATISFINEATGRVATLTALQFNIDPVYGYRYANLDLNSSDWADPAVNLPGKNWKLTGSGIDPGIKDSTGALFTDVYARMQGCARDGFISFNSDGTFFDNEGPTKCDDADPQSIKGTWTLNANRSLLTMLWGNATAAMEFTVGAMTPATLKLSDDKQSWPDGKVHKLTLTFSAP
jgi:hypothetical protein